MVRRGLPNPSIVYPDYYISMQVASLCHDFVTTDLVSLEESARTLGVLDVDG